METKIKATVYAARLRKRLAELKTQRVKDLEAHKAGVAKWKKEMVAWLISNGEKRIGALTVTYLKSHESRYEHRSVPFSSSDFFAGCPTPPAFPDDKQIRDITSLLRHLGITGQETVRVTTEDVARYLGDGEKDVA